MTTRKPFARMNGAEIESVRLLPYAVVYQRSWTQSPTAPPIRFATRDEAETEARAYNRTNQDRTWDAAAAYVVDVRCEGRT